MLIGCMGGGFCNAREGCANYQDGSVDKFVERLCGKIEEPTVIKEYEDKPVCGSNQERTALNEVTGQ